MKAILSVSKRNGGVSALMKAAGRCGGYSNVINRQRQYGIFNRNGQWRSA
jgi:hypothetical protein